MTKLSNEFEMEKYETTCVCVVKLRLEREIILRPVQRPDPVDTRIARLQVRKTAHGTMIGTPEFKTASGGQGRIEMR